MDDTWKFLFETYLNFISNCVVVVIAFLLRRTGLIAESHIDGLRMAAFTLALPAFMLQSVWKADVSAEQLQIIPIVLTVSMLCMLSVSAAVRWIPNDLRGLYSMALTGHSMAYVLPVVLQSSRFGVDYVPVVLTWELGGNICVTNLFYGVAAVVYSPLREAERQINEDSNQRIPGSHPVCIGNASGASGDGVSPSGSPDKLSSLTDIQVDIARESDGNHGVEDGGAPAVQKQNLRCGEVACKVSKTPMLWGALTGLLLNFLQVPQHDFPCIAIKNIASTFSVLLYALLGASIRFDIGKSNYCHTVAMLGSRWLIALFFILLLRIVPGINATQKSVITLCLMGPVATPYVMYAMKYNHPLGLAMMVYNMSSFFSVLALNLLEPVV